MNKARCWHVPAQADKLLMSASLTSLSMLYIYKLTGSDTDRVSAVALKGHKVCVNHVATLRGRAHVT
jgi:hypothetical protein